MATKMVTSFRRSLSFPNPPPSKPRKALHVRSTSLPCRSHPIISQLRHELAELASWSAADHASRTAAWLCDGLHRLKSVHESLDDLLHLPQTCDALRGGACSAPIERFLEDFLRFVDAYGTFQTLALRLKEECSAAQVAVRRKDDSRTAAHSKSLSKIAKEIGKLAASFPPAGKLSAPAAPYDEKAELIEAIGDVVGATVSASAILFGGLSNSTAFRKAPTSRFGVKTRAVEGGIREFQETMGIDNLRKKTEAEVKTATRRMHEMEDRILEIEGCGERAFRSLINTRVSLLNVVTQ